MRTAVVQYARKRLKTLAISTGKRIGRRVLRRARKTRVGKAISKFRSFAGASVQKSNSVRNTSFTAAVPEDTFATNALLNISQGVGIQQRESNVIFLKGIRFIYNFTNLTSVPLYVNFACLTPKQGRTISNGLFFRSNEAETNVDFNTATLSSFSKHVRAINSDYYIIHFHKRMTLDVGLESSTYKANRNNFKKFDFYYRINSRVTYSDRGTPEFESPDNQMIIVIWYNRMNLATTSPGAVNVLSIENDSRIIFDGE